MEFLIVWALISFSIRVIFAWTLLEAGKQASTSFQRKVFLAIMTPIVGDVVALYVITVCAFGWVNNV